MVHVQKKKKAELEGPPIPVKVERDRAQEIKHTIPTKVGECDPFLENMHAEFTYLGFEGAGRVLGGRVGYGAEVVDLELGIGMLDLTAHKPLIYISPSIEVNGQPGRFDIYGNIHMAILPGNEDVAPITAMYVDAGAVWRVLESKEGKVGFRLGIGLDTATDIGKSSTSLEMRGAEFGAAVDYGNATFYAIEEVMFHRKHLQEAGWKIITPQHRNIKGGLRLQLEPAEIDMQIFYNQLETGGMVAISTDTGKIIPEIYASVSHGMLPFLGDKAMIGARIRFGGKKKQLALEAAHVFGGGRGLGSAKHLRMDDAEEEAADLFAEHIDNAESFEEFTDQYANESVEDVLYAAQKLGKIAGESADTETWAKIVKKTGFSQEYQDALELSNEELYSGLRDIFLDGDTEQNRLWACVAISLLQASMFRKRGMKTYLLGMTSQGGSHVAVITQNPETKESYLVSFDVLFSDENGTIWPLLRGWEEFDRCIIRGFYLYGENNEVINYYETPQGKMMRKAAGAGKDPLEEILKRK